jgi:small multidrug resistance family-3 protein
MRALSISKGTAFIIFLLAAVLEVAGDALVRRGLRGASVAFGALGFCVLGSYGVVVNLLPLDFSRLLGTYVAVFAVVSVVAGALVFGDRVPVSTWVGLAIILAGSLVIYLGSRAT